MFQFQQLKTNLRFNPTEEPDRLAQLNKLQIVMF